MKDDPFKICSPEGGCTHSPFLSCEISSPFASPCCTILESSSDGVFTVDLEKKITSFNHAAELITGFKAIEAIGQNCLDILRTSVCTGITNLELRLKGAVLAGESLSEYVAKRCQRPSSGRRA